MGGPDRTCGERRTGRYRNQFLTEYSVPEIGYYVAGIAAALRVVRS